MSDHSDTASGAAGYKALVLRPEFRVDGWSGEVYFGYNDPDGWPLYEDDAQNVAAIAALKDEISRAFSPIVEHFHAMGCIRADRTVEVIWNGEADDDDREPTFYLVFEDGAGSVDPLSLSIIPEDALELTSLPGAMLRIGCHGELVDLPALHGALLSCDLESTVGQWGGNTTPDKLPVPGEGCGDWLARVAMPAERLGSVLAQWEMAGHDLDLYARYSAPRKDPNPDWLVEGIIAFGVLTLIVGSGSAGKSSACHELLSAAGGVAGSRPKTFLGRPIDGRYPTALLCGEEPEWIFPFRRERHETIWSDCGIMIFPGSAADLLPVLAKLESLPPGVLVIDPAQVYIDGDDTKSYVTSDFYSPVVAFARRSGWAVIVSAHLVKEPAKSLARMIPSVKGSTVHTDRARMVIGMIDRGNGIVEIGPIKSNFPAELVWQNVNEGRLYRRDADTYTLIPADVATPPTQQPSAHDELVFDAVLRLNMAGERVRRTGRFGLFEKKAPELNGVTRNATLNAVASLMECGRVIDTGDGLIAVIEPS